MGQATRGAHTSPAGECSENVLGWAWRLLDPPLLRSHVRPPLSLSQTWSGHRVHSVPWSFDRSLEADFERKEKYRRVILSYLGVVRKHMNSGFTLKNLELIKIGPNKSVVRACPPLRAGVVCHIVRWLGCEIHVVWTHKHNIISPIPRNDHYICYKYPPMWASEMKSNPVLNQGFIWEVFVFLGDGLIYYDQLFNHSD